MYNYQSFLNFFINNQAQFLLIIISITCSVILTLILERLFLKTKNRNYFVANQELKLVLNKKSLFYSSLLLTIFISLATANVLTISNHIIKPFSKIIIVILIFHLVKSSFTTSLRKILMIMIVGPIILNIFNILNPIVYYLDSFGIIIGSINFSIFFLIKIIYIISFIILVGKTITNFGESKIRAQHEWNINTREILVKLFDSLLYIILFILGLNLLGVNLTALNVFSGALGLGLGVALQKIGSNFLSGIILLFEKTINVGDFIEYQTGVKGTVRHLGVRTTVIEDGDGGEVILPNDLLINSKIINCNNQLHHIKVITTVHASYEKDPIEVCQILIKSAELNHKTEFLPTVCYISEFLEKYIEYKLEYWVEANTKLAIKSQILANIWTLFKQSGIKFI